MPVQAKGQEAKKALAQNSQQLLTEISQLAELVEQSEPDQSLKRMANQISTLANQVQFNMQTENKL